ncbi:MAG TPA: right-handed parallel beta-helix repeat-containing protein [Fibrobacteria bacterium]|nr:right-handed parallel beta-helix repeat-containing protein [Fibrobacteria bacterium]
MSPKSPLVRPFFLAAALALAAQPSHARRLAVGPGKTYAKPSLAAAAAQKGDTVDIDVGVYTGDACTWDADNLLIRGVPVAGVSAKYAHLDSKGVHVQGKGIWVVDGKNTTIENIEFSGAKVPDENGAGIRQQGPGVTIRNCYFHDNENGVFGAGYDMIIEYTEFNHNGLGERGRTHNIYIDEGSSLTLRHCYSHHAVIGHNVKSRAVKNYILYNRIMDEADGTSSYDIDLPNGGFAIIMGNVIQQGPDTDNSTIVSYGAEGYKNAPNELYFVNNTLVNDRSGGAFLNISAGAAVAKVRNNFFVGSGTLVSGTMTDSGGNVASATGGLVNKAAYDYRITAASPAVNKGTAAGSAGDFALTPLFEYVHPVSRQARVLKGAIDAGAYEVGDPSGIKGPRAGSKTKAGGKAGKGSARRPDAAGFHPALPTEPDTWFDSAGRHFDGG